jgi:hypothetical protein
LLINGLEVAGAFNFSGLKEDITVSENYGPPPAEFSEHSQRAGIEAVGDRIVKDIASPEKAGHRPRDQKTAGQARKHSAKTH